VTGIGSLLTVKLCGGVGIASLLKLCGVDRIVSLLTIKLCGVAGMNWP